MKKYIRLVLMTVVIISIMQIILPVCAWSDSDGGRPVYTTDEVNSGALGPVGEDAQGQPGYPGTIVFNSISDSVIGNEFNCVGARECLLLEDGSWAGATKDTLWNGNDIDVSDSTTYVIRLYVNNNNPNGYDAVAEDTKVAFSIPGTPSTQIKVRGVLTSSNATPSEYTDYVNFNSTIPFHLEYIYGSAMLENNGIGLGGIKLSDDIIEAKEGGILIGYDALDGKIPGGFQHDNTVTIVVRAVFDYEYTTETRVRLADSEDKTWQKTVDAKVGDKVEFMIEYANTSNSRQEGVVIRDVLPSNLRYVEGSTKIMNDSHPNGDRVLEDYLVEGGIVVGNYGPDANVYILFTAEVVDENLGYGSNTMVNWGRASVGSKVIQDYARVHVEKNTKSKIIIIVMLSVLILICVAAIVWLLYKMKKLNKD